MASLPRAGSTLFRTLLFHYYGVPSYSFYNDPIFALHGVDTMIGHINLPRVLKAYVRANGNPAPSSKLSQWTRAGEPFVFIKVHHYPGQLPGRCENAVCIIRDPRDSAVSVAHYKHWRKRIPFQKALNIVVSGLAGGQYNWSGFLMDWNKRDNTVVVKFEDMVTKPGATLRQAMNDLGIPLETVRTSEPPRFAALHKKLPQFFRQGKTNVWQDVLSSGQVETVLRRHGEMMQEMGYL